MKLDLILLKIANKNWIKEEEETTKLTKNRTMNTFITELHTITSWQNDPPICKTCGLDYTEKHIITVCQK